MKTIEQELKLYRPLVRLNSILSKKARDRIIVFLSYVFILGILVSAGYVVFDSLSEKVFTLFSLTEELAVLTGIFLVCFGPYSVLLGINFFFNTYYFRGLTKINEESLDEKTGITYEVASLLHLNSHDITQAFLLHQHGQDIMLRSGISLEACSSFLESNRSQISAHNIPLNEGHFLTLSDITEYIVQSDPVFKEFIFKHGVTEESLNGASGWVTRAQIRQKLISRWWSRDRLSKISGIGRSLSYGVAYNLRAYMRDLNSTSALSMMMSDVAYANEIIGEIEAVLTRNKAANVLLVGEPGVGKMDMLIELSKRMREGDTIASLSSKRIIVFDTDTFSAVYNDKKTFEPTFLSLMNQAERAGGIIVVIPDYSLFMASTKAIDVNLNELLDRYMTSPHIQFVVTTDQSNYHQSLETNPALLRQFASVFIEDPDLKSTVRILEEAAPYQESIYNVVFTYDSLTHIVENANQYLIEGVMPDKALTFMEEVASIAHKDKKLFITADFVDVNTSKKTGIPTGPIRSEEKDLLLNLEEVLHKRVIGQNDAIDAIASTMRRARAGIQSKDKPIGSFLFLGPTGVGKTETAKALAHVFFESAENMLRLDMSEYSDDNSLERLIGSSTEAGELSSLLREHPYCVLLLDEFEKAATDVHDLFLQILDEGFVTDSRGKKVNARNTIVVATSNAGSDLIWNLMQEGKKPGDSKEQIVDAIIDSHIFKPELINRFDATVIFEVLSVDQQEKIAEIMLNELKDRIKQKGYTLVVTETLIKKLVEKGFDPKFGARPMLRVIQDVVEERIALKIIEGDLKKGDEIILDENDLD